MGLHTFYFQCILFFFWDDKWKYNKDNLLFLLPCPFCVKTKRSFWERKTWKSGSRCVRALFLRNFSWQKNKRSTQFVVFLNNLIRFMLAARIPVVKNTKKKSANSTFFFCPKNKHGYSLSLNNKHKDGISIQGNF